MSKPRYIIERWPLGWILCSGPCDHGIPINAFAETEKLFSKRDVMDPAIVHHLRAIGKLEARVCITSIEDSKKWHAEITASISALPLEERWWKGLDVGTSSASIFSVFSQSFQRDAEELSRKSRPHDASDFGRCKRLLDLFPEWKANLGKVAEKYADTK